MNDQEMFNLLSIPGAAEVIGTVIDSPDERRVKAIISTKDIKERLIEIETFSDSQLIEVCRKRGSVNFYNFQDILMMRLPELTLC